MPEAAGEDELRSRMNNITLSSELRDPLLSDSSSEGDARQVENADRKEHNGRPTSRASNGHTANGIGSEDPKTTAKFLVTNQAAGSIIGKGGANINELQRKAGAKLQLSRATEFFPGTHDRVLTVSGFLPQITSILTLILESWLKDAEEDEDSETELKFLAPSAVCGILIGKAGINIKGYTKESGCSITVSGVHEQLPGVSERVVTITGKVEQVTTAVGLILSKLQESKHYNRLASVPVNYQSGVAGWRNPGIPMPMATHNALLPNTLQADPNVEAEISLQVPDARVGAIIGKGGEIISQIKNLLEVGIRISDRETFVPGTRDREITIRGPPGKVHIANQLIHDRIHATEVASSPATSRRRQ